MWETLPKSLSTFSGDIDHLFWGVTYLMSFSWVLSTIVMVYLFIAFRRKEGVKAQYLPGESGKQLLLIYIPLALFVCFDMYIDLTTAAVWKKAKMQIPAADVNVKAIAQQWAWTFIQEGDIETINELHIPAGKTVHVAMESSDTLHSLAIPIFRFKQDVIPGRIITGWFKAKSFEEVKSAKLSMFDRFNARPASDTLALSPHEDEEGTATFDIQCAEMCGVGHGIMAARIIIHSQDSYDAWVKGEKELIHEMQEDAGMVEESTPNDGMGEESMTEGTEG
jgi:cytochrome c oxidase subunit 2